jgi:hypothetical protein
LIIGVHSGLLVCTVLVTEGHQYGSCFEVDDFSWVVAKKESSSFIYKI